MRNLLVFALLAPALVSSVAIPSSDDADLVKEEWGTIEVVELIETHSAPARVRVDFRVTKAVTTDDDVSKSNEGFPVILWQPLDAVNSKPSAYLDPALGDEDVYEPTVEEDIFELEYLQAQLKELKYLIREKKRAVDQRLGQDKPSIAECDSLKCVAQAVKDKARVAAHKVIGKVTGNPEEEESLRFPKFHWPKPPFHHGKPGNHTCGPPKHGKSNHTLPHPPPRHGKGNHTHPHPPPPHFKRPHLPFCHYPPPPPPPPPHRHPKPPHKKPPPHRGPPAHDRPPHGKPPPKEPDKESSLPSFDSKPSQELFQLLEATDLREPVIFSESLQGHRVSRSPRKAIIALSLGLFVFIFTIIVKYVLARFSTPDQRAARQTRRSECQHRRSLRRAAHRKSILNILTRLGYQTTSQQDEEKRAALADDALSTTMTEDIAGLMNAADMVSEMVAAEEGRARRSMHCEGEGENLPVYAGQDDPEHVADGRIGNSGYIPSPAGSASDILGVDTKQ